MEHGRHPTGLRFRPAAVVEPETSAPSRHAEVTISSGSARRLPWSGAPRLVRPDGDVTNPAPEVREATAPPS